MTVIETSKVTDLDDEQKKKLFKLITMAEGASALMKKRAETRNHIVFGDMKEDWDKERELENVDFLDERIDESFGKISELLKDLFALNP